MADETAAIDYKVLAQKHPEYRGELWAELDVLYRGGYAIDEYRTSFLKQEPNEHGKVYASRCRNATYINYLGMIVDYFSAAVFQRPVMVSPSEGSGSEALQEAYDAFAEQAGKGGDTLQRLLRKVLTQALVCKRAYLAVDFPVLDESEKARLTQADVEALQLGRPYAWDVSSLEVIDWHEGDDGTLDWCVMHQTVCERESFSDDRDEVTERFRVWDVVDIAEPGAESRMGARCRVYEMRRKANRKPSGKVELTKTLTTDFRRVPVLPFELPDGLWVGNKVGPLAKEHFQRRSKLQSAIARSLFAIPWVGLGPELGAHQGQQPAEVQQDAGRGDDLVAQLEDRGFAVLGAGDSIQYAEPTGNAYKLEDDQIAGLVDEMFRVGHQMSLSIKSNSKALARSGLSKAEDRHATEIVLGDLGERVRDFAVRIYDTIAEARGEAVDWEAKGCDEFQLWDRDSLIAEAAQVRDIDIPSDTFRGEYMTDIAKRLLKNPSPQLIEDIRAEIESGITNEQREAKAALAALGAQDYANDAEDDEGDTEGPASDRSGADQGQPARGARVTGRGNRSVARRRSTV